MIDVDQIRQKLTHAFDEILVFEGFFEENFEELKDDIERLKYEPDRSGSVVNGFRVQVLSPKQRLSYNFNRKLNHKMTIHNPKYEFIMPSISNDYETKKVVKFKFPIDEDIKIHMWNGGYYHLQYQLFDYLLRVKPNLTIDGTFLREDFPLSKDINSWTNKDLVMLRLMS